MLLLDLSRGNVEKKKEKASVTSICLDLKHPYTGKVVAGSYLVGYLLHNSKSSMQDEKYKATCGSLSLILWIPC